MTRPDPRLMILASLWLAACNRPDPDVLPGYVEAEYTRMASPVAGRLIELKVARGAEVAAGTPLFVLDTEQERAAVDEARARVQQSQANEADLAKGKRAEEIAVLDAQAREVAAQLAQAEADLKRQRELATQGFTSGAALDTYQTRVKTNTAQLAQIRANLEVARLAARSDTRAAAAANVQAARAALAQSEWKRDQKAVVAPVLARVDDTLYRLGEWVPAGSPVVSLLAPEAIKLRFFVPQAALPRVTTGQMVRVSCDGCGEAMQATVSFIAREAEFTPPVIFSQQNRERLVFMVEARPAAQDLARLHPGLPVDVRLPARQP